MWESGAEQNLVGTNERDFILSLVDDSVWASLVYTLHDLEGISLQLSTSIYVQSPTWSAAGPPDGGPLCQRAHVDLAVRLSTLQTRYRQRQASRSSKRVPRVTGRLY
jgi:hypothetical protein